MIPSDLQVTLMEWSFESRQATSGAMLFSENAIYAADPNAGSTDVRKRGPANLHLPWRVLSGCPAAAAVGVVVGTAAAAALSFCHC